MSPRQPAVGAGRLAAPRWMSCLSSGRLVCSLLVCGLLAIPTVQPAAAQTAAPGTLGDDPSQRDLRQMMVQEQIIPRGISQESVLEAMENVPRHLFVPDRLRARAYEDEPIPLTGAGHEGPSIYPPYMVARMTELLELSGDEKVLEIGTGSGYHTAVLARVARQVCTVEISEVLGRLARRRLATMGFTNIDVRIGDGYNGWPAQAPFDAIILTAAPPFIPQPLLDQLKDGGKMVIPIGGGEFLQDLVVITKTEDGLERRKVAPVRAPTMTGEAQDR